MTGSTRNGESRTTIHGDRSVILAEEVGQVATAVLHILPNASLKDLQALKDYKDELIRVAAVAIAAIECLDRQSVLL